MSAYDALIADLAGAQHGLVTRWQLLASGVGPAAIETRIQDGRLRRVHAGVYSAGAVPLAQKGRWMAGVLAGGSGAALGWRSAAAMHDIRATTSPWVEVVVPGGSRRRRRGNLLLHTARRPFHPDDTMVVDAIRVTTPERTLLDLADVLPFPQLQRAYEQAERLELLDHTRLRALAERSNGRRGRGRFRAVIAYNALHATRLRSELEVAFSELVGATDLPPYQANVIVAGEEVDAYWPEARLAVELQSHRWHSDRSAFERDHRKRMRLMSAGETLVALTYEQVTREGPAVVAFLQDLHSRGARPPLGARHNPS